MSSNKFIGFRIGICNDGGVPIATGLTREEVEVKARRRVLSTNDLHSTIQVEERPNMSDYDFATVTSITDNWAIEHCGEKR